MKAIIFNSGIGNRMGSLTKNNPKCMVKLYNGETIFERQIRILSECGIKDFIITTGPFKDQLYEIANKYKNLNFNFVDNPEYKTTNYIVSMNYAYDFIDDDMLLLHGDLVFNKNIVIKLLNNKNKSVCLFNENKKLPEKDFKGRFKENILKEVSINIFDNDCYAFQPLYKLSKADITKWKNKARDFVNNGIVNVYAENSLNEITNEISIYGMSYKDDYIDEIDNEQDYIRVSNEIKYFDYQEQIIENTDDYISILSKYISKNENIFVVCGNSIKDSIMEKLESINANITIFSDFTSNPKYEDIKKGIDLFKNIRCNKIISIGGGSTIDVAKCIKLFSTLDNDSDFLYNKYNYNNIMHIAIPTTSGTGSESTGIAVIYYNDKKLSIDHGSILPQIAILDYNFLITLSDYQKKSTLLDSMCQAIESYWSKGATNESKEYSSKCIDLILENYKPYFNNHNLSLKNMLIASNYSGKAINISRTTAPHSMSYKLSSLYNISHGHAVALCLIPCWKLLLEKSKIDNKLNENLDSLSKILKQNSILGSINFINDLIAELNMPKVNIKEVDLEELVNSVNVERMSNNPIAFNQGELYELYKNIK